MASPLQDPTAESSMDHAPIPAPENPSSSLSAPPGHPSPVPFDPSPPSPTQSQLLAQLTATSLLPAQTPSLILPPATPSELVDESPEVSRALTNWQAARDSVLSQMVTSQDIVTPATVPRVKAKTGGRRGRGGRRSMNQTPSQVDSGLEAVVSTPPGTIGRGKGRGRGRGGGRPRVRPIGSASGSKRKKTESDEEIKVVKVAKVTQDGSDSSETFTPLPTQSRSGRRIFKASTFTPVVIDLEASAELKPPPVYGAVTPMDRGKRGKKGHRKTGDASVCKNCGRGHSPASNMIVFCDGCNTPWHQYCHDKPIGNDVVLIEEKEWYCADCEVLREEQVQLKGKVSAEGMSLAEVRSSFILCRETLPPIAYISWRFVIETALFTNPSLLASCFPSSPCNQSPPGPTNLLRQPFVRAWHHHVFASSKLYRQSGCGGRGRNLRSLPRFRASSISQSGQRCAAPSRERRSRVSH